MELRQIEYFLAVAEHEGISGAAAALGVAQPTMSQAIASLEREVRTPLFQRIGRGMILTSAGRALLGPGRAMVRDVAVAVEAVTVPDGRLGGHLHIAATPSLVSGPMTTLIAHFRRLHPGVAIRVSDLREEHRGASFLRHGLCDLVVSHLPLPDSDGFDTQVLGVDEYWVVFPPGTDVPEADPLPIGDLPDIPFVIVPSGGALADHIEQEVRQSGNRIRVGVITEHREARLPLVAEGLGATFLERSVAEAARHRVVVRALTPSLSTPFGLVFDAAALVPAAAAFVALARTTTDDG